MFCTLSITAEDAEDRRHVSDKVCALVVLGNCRISLINRNRAVSPDIPVLGIAKSPAKKIEDLQCDTMRKFELLA
jgi:NaMN:DMB phosphoribosyltransferase